MMTRISPLILFEPAHMRWIDFVIIGIPGNVARQALRRSLALTRHGGRDGPEPRLTAATLNREAYP